MERKVPQRQISVYQKRVDVIHIRYLIIKLIIMKIRLLSDKAKMPTVAGNSIQFYCSDIKPEVGNDNRVMLTYTSDVSVEIPEGKIGLIYQPFGSEGKSLELASGIKVYNSGQSYNIEARFKTNTDAIPNIYEAGDNFISMILINEEKIEISVEENKTIEGEPTNEIL